MNKIVSLFSVIAILTSFTIGLAQAQTPTENINNPVYKDAKDLLEDVNKRHKEYIDLRKQNLDELNVIENSVKISMNKRLSDISTQLNITDTSLQKITDENYADMLLEIQSDIADTNFELQTINTEDREILIKEINDSYIENYHETLKSISNLMIENELKISSYEKIMDQIDELDDLIGELNGNYSESDWARVEENFKLLQNMLNEEADTILTTLQTQ